MWTWSCQLNQKLKKIPRYRTVLVACTQYSSAREEDRVHSQLALGNSWSSRTGSTLTLGSPRAIDIDREPTLVKGTHKGHNSVLKLDERHLTFLVTISIHHHRNSYWRADSLCEATRRTTRGCVHFRHQSASVCTMLNSASLFSASVSPPVLHE